LVKGRFFTNIGVEDLREELEEVDCL